MGSCLRKKHKIPNEKDFVGAVDYLRILSIPLLGDRKNSQSSSISSIRYVFRDESAIVKTAWRRYPRERPHYREGRAMSSDITPDPMDVLCKLFMDAMKVNPEARPVFMSLVETLMDNQVRQEQWGSIMFCVWQELLDQPSSGAHHDGNG
jgi:hypothetical protein